MPRSDRSLRSDSKPEVRTPAGTDRILRSKPAREGKSRLFDSSIVGTASDAVEFITNILESSTEYSVIAKDLQGNILLWNEGVRRIYGYEPEEVVGKANSSILHIEEDVHAGKPREILQAALAQGKWEGTLLRKRKNGEHFSARVVITPRYGVERKPVGFQSMRRIFFALVEKVAK